MPGELLHGLPAVAGGSPHTLILGNMPSVLSLASGQYYGNPRNAFWQITADILGFDAAAPYEQRVRALVGHRIAVWDVLRSCRRAGSLDSAVERDSMVPNDFGAFLRDHPQIDLLLFNGAAAEANYRRLVRDAARVPSIRLPSTSPAHTMRFADKLAHWRTALTT
ncbi:DNA-deoxyinosine glycosylase [Mycobacterium sp. ITM-2016-00316]|uniref:DNA-deoxyinosine glycosylase n=1 Tax=Mycobacterium sp. ITM-2016-00316 TaxID=2099695 RepID=UPI000CF9E597|nr:DNA-deoxyinosine glycosylase [Mycobacterium sp. ITM-2016-00316]WNG80649.1 DNA-deoxyinosine glycosylase [Mycobacterium sp. ITM-2016-00316]